MPDPNTLVIQASDWVPQGQWRRASRRDKQRYLDGMEPKIKRQKLRQIEKSQGANARQLAARKRARPDGADGPVLAPHNDTSRSEKWIRTAVSVNRGTVAVYWSHGWNRILGYHRAGEGRYGAVPIRNIIDFPKYMLNQLAADGAQYWREIQASKARDKPPVPAQQQPFAQPARRAPVGRPQAARPMMRPREL